MMRLSYRDPYGVEHVEDLVGPSHWGPLQYRRAFARQHPTASILAVEPVHRDVRAVPGDHPQGWIITLRIPGRPLTTVHQPGGWAEARRLALMGVDGPAQIVRMVQA